LQGEVARSVRLRGQSAATARRTGGAGTTGAPRTGRSGRRGRTPAYRSPWRICATAR